LKEAGKYSNKKYVKRRQIIFVTKVRAVDVCRRVV
jgi:hypothetical protein